MSGSVTPISGLQLALSVLLVLIPGVMAAAMRLGLLRSLAWAAVRAFVQLMLIGYVLTTVLAIDNPALVALIVGVMCYIAARASRDRAPNVPDYSVGLAFLAMAASTYLVATLVCALIIGASPWYTAQVVLPIAGMILGNSLTGITLSVDRLYGEVRNRVGEIETWLALGATPHEAVRDCQREALRAGMTPIINAMMIVGVVSLPGMMSGQILSGVDPHMAARYQIVVMFMIAAAVAIGCIIFVWLAAPRLFTADAALKPELRAGISRS